MEDAKVINFTKSLVKVYLDKCYAIEDFGGEEEFMEMGYVAIGVALEVGVNKFRIQMEGSRLIVKGLEALWFP